MEIHPQVVLDPIFFVLVVAMWILAKFKCPWHKDTTKMVPLRHRDTPMCVLKQRRPPRETTFYRDHNNVWRYELTGQPAPALVQEWCTHVWNSDAS
jgi:hypothetical protein